MVVQGYGESDLAVRTLTAERANRRVAVRRITQLLSGAQ
jgi:outer membrane protein OmpA-like peptidoglycan-associated protein